MLFFTNTDAVTVRALAKHFRCQEGFVTTNEHCHVAYPTDCQFELLMSKAVYEVTRVGRNINITCYWQADMVDTWVEISVKTYGVKRVACQQLLTALFPRVCTRVRLWRQFRGDGPSSIAINVHGRLISVRVSSRKGHGLPSPRRKRRCTARQHKIVSRRQERCFGTLANWR